MASKNYSSVNTIKDYALKTLIPKYFPDNVNTLNLGLLGYTTEFISNTTEDSFNSMTILMKEMFPNKARMPESIYNYAALFQEENLFANPAYMNIMLFINEKDIINLGEKVSSTIEFHLDQNMIIDIEGKQFLPDYEILISAKPFQNDYIFTAMYNMSSTNSISDITNPYIKTKRIKYNSNNYVGLLIKVRQCNKFTKVEHIINNDKINLPSISVNFNDQLANFEVFYKKPNGTNYIQLKKRLLNSTPIRQEFCYYNFTDSDEFNISFTSRNNYFQPEFNSEILIEYYTTIGSKGNFSEYSGTEVNVLIKSEKYDYNNGLVIFAIPQSGAVEGKNTLSIEELRNIVIEKFSTVGSYTNENDLKMYFSNYKYKFGNEMMFIKKRDDIYQRLFSAFALMKDPNGNMYPTNTLHMDLLPSDFDSIHEQTNTYILKPGNLFTYKSDSIDTSQKIPGKKITDDLSSITEDFIYTNPFLMTVMKSPSIVGFYLNSVSSKLLLDYSYVSTDSIVQFICNNLFIERNALNGEDEYTLKVILTPTIELENPLVDQTTGADLGLLKVKAMIEDGGQEFCYINFTLKSYDAITKLYTFESKLTTDDYMTLTNKMRVFDAIDLQTSVQEIKLIPMYNCKINICAFYKNADALPINKYSFIDDVKDFTLTNIYSTIDEKVNFITPISIIRSQLKYVQLDETNYKMNLSFVPLVKAEILKDSTLYSDFITGLYNQYEYMQDVLNKIINNYAIDIKFYNTYGKSKNFTAGENGALLNKVNCSIRLSVAPTVGTDVANLIRDLKIFIKGIIETTNESGSNNIYISNLMRKIEEEFSGVKYQKFIQINNYDSLVQIIENKTINFIDLTKETKKNFVPEYLTISLDDIYIDII